MTSPRRRVSSTPASVPDMQPLPDLENTGVASQPVPNFGNTPTDQQFLDMSTTAITVLPSYSRTPTTLRLVATIDDSNLPIIEEVALFDVGNMDHPSISMLEEMWMTAPPVFTTDPQTALLPYKSMINVLRVLTNQRLPMSTNLTNGDHVVSETQAES